MKESPSLGSEPAPKKAKTEDCGDDDALCELVWNHFECYQQSLDESPDQAGDTDELAEIIELLSSKKSSIPPCTDLSSIERCVDMLPVLWSVVSHLLADVAIGELLALSDANNQGAKESEVDEKIREVHKLLEDAIHYFPMNASTWSMTANYARMILQKGGKAVPLHTSQLLTSPLTVARWYQHAATCAQQVRSQGLKLLEKEDESQDGLDVKPWIESLLMNCVVGVEWIPDDDEEEGGTQDEEDIGSNDSEEEEKDSEEIGGAWSGSATEATSHFMAAMQLSIANKHDEALGHLQEFPFTHRLHPNLWKSSTGQENSITHQSTSNMAESPVFVFGSGNESSGVLPLHLYQQLCKVFEPKSPYWTESSYSTRGYYSYFMDKKNASDGEFSNLIYEVIQGHLLPKVQSILDRRKHTEQIVGFEWWTHTRPLGANLGHNLHFDTDEALLSQEGLVTHPIYSSVLYLTGEPHGGPTLVLDQTPDSTENASRAWSCSPKDNTFLVFPGNLLHGVLPCSNGSKDEPPATSKPSINQLINATSKNENSIMSAKHRLTFMVGFWTRRVPDKMRERKLYAPCGPIPPPTEEHSWVQQIERDYKGGSLSSCDPIPSQAVPVPSISPVWQKIIPKEKPEAESLEIPKTIDHRFFVEDAPECFRASLFEDIEASEITSHPEAQRMVPRIPLLLTMLAMATLSVVLPPSIGVVEAADFDFTAYNHKRSHAHGWRRSSWGVDFGRSQRTTNLSSLLRGGSSVSGSDSSSPESSSESDDHRNILGSGDPFVQAAPFILAMTARDGSVALVAAHSSGGLEEMEPLLYQMSPRWGVPNKQPDAENIGNTTGCRSLLDLPSNFGGPMRIQSLGPSLTLLATGWRADCDALVEMGQKLVSDERKMLGSRTSSGMLGNVVATQLSEWMAQLVNSEGDRALSCAALIVDATGNIAATGQQSPGSVWLVEPGGAYPVRALALGQQSNSLNQDFLARTSTFNTARDGLKALLEKLHSDPSFLSPSIDETAKLRLEMSILEVDGGMKRVELGDILPGFPN